MSVFKTRGKHAESLGKDDTPPAPKIAPACKACSPLDFGPCTCPEDCKHLSCTGAWRETPPRSEAPARTVTREAVKADLEARAELTELGAQPTVIIPALAEPEPEPAPDLPADIRSLPVFRDALRVHAQRLHVGCECEPEGIYLHLMASEGAAA